MVWGPVGVDNWKYDKQKISTLPLEKRLSTAVFMCISSPSYGKREETNNNLVNLVLEHQTHFWNDQAMTMKVLILPSILTLRFFLLYVQDCIAQLSQVKRISHRSMVQFCRIQMMQIFVRSCIFHFELIRQIMERSGNLSCPRKLAFMLQKQCH